MFPLTFDTCIRHTFNVIFAEDKEEDHHRDGVEHGADQRQIPLRFELLLKNAKSDVEHIFVCRVQVQEWLKECIPHGLELENEHGQKRGARERNDDLAVNLGMFGTINHRCLFQILGEGLKELGQQKYTPGTHRTCHDQAP